MEILVNTRKDFTIKIYIFQTQNNCNVQVVCHDVMDLILIEIQPSEEFLSGSFAHLICTACTLTVDGELRMFCSYWTLEILSYPCGALSFKYLPPIISGSECSSSSPLPVYHRHRHTPHYKINQDTSADWKQKSVCFKFIQYWPPRRVINV